MEHMTPRHTKSSFGEQTPTQNVILIILLDHYTKLINDFLLYFLHLVLALTNYFLQAFHNLLVE